MPPVNPQQQTPLASAEKEGNKVLLILGGVFIVCLLIGGAYVAGGANILGNFFADESRLESTVSTTTKGIIVVKSNDIQGSRNPASVLLINAIGEQKVLAEVTNYKLGTFLPELQIANGKIYFIGPNNTIAVFSIEKGLMSTIQHKENSWDIQDLAVGGDTLVYLAMGPWKDTESVPSEPCAIHSINLTTGTEVELLSIPVCSQAHGPNVSLHGISADGASLIYFVEYGEAGHAFIEEHALDFITKKDTIVRTVMSSPVCTEGMFFDEVECTQDVRNENAEYDAFTKKYLIGSEWTATCGEVTVRKEDTGYYKLYVTAGDKELIVEDAEYVGCYQ